jgi:hypothetical protein
VKRVRKTEITRREGDNEVTVSMTLKWDPKDIPPERQKQIWEGIGAILAAAMTPEERADFLEKLRRETQESEGRKKRAPAKAATQL